MNTSPNVIIQSPHLHLAAVASFFFHHLCRPSAHPGMPRNSSKSCVFFFSQHDQYFILHTHTESTVQPIKSPRITHVCLFVGSEVVMNDTLRGRQVRQGGGGMAHCWSLHSHTPVHRHCSCTSAQASPHSTPLAGWVLSE